MTGLEHVALGFPFTRCYPESDTASARLSEAGFFCAIFSPDAFTIRANSSNATIGVGLSPRLFGPRRSARPLWLTPAVPGCRTGSGL